MESILQVITSPWFLIAFVAGVLAAIADTAEKERLVTRITDAIKKNKT